jgi:hypothetical protein
VAAVVFDRAARTMAPALGASIIPLLPIISHFAFDFHADFPQFSFDPITHHVPPLTAPFRKLLNTRWFLAVTQTASAKLKL